MTPDCTMLGVDVAKANALRVALEIYDRTIVKNEVMSCEKLFWAFDGRLKEHELSKALDYLFDTGMLKTSWKIYNKERLFRRQARVCTLALTISEEALSFFKDIYERVVRPESCLVVYREQNQ